MRNFRVVRAVCSASCLCKTCMRFRDGSDVLDNVNVVTRRNGYRSYGTNLQQQQKTEALNALTINFADTHQQSGSHKLHWILSFCF